MLSRLLTYRPGLLLASLLLWTAGFCVPVLTGLVNRVVFNALDTRTSDRPNLWLAFAALIAIGVAEPALMFCWYWLHTTFETTLEALVRTNLFSWVLAMSGRRGAQASPATLVGHLRDDVPGYTDLVNEWYRLFGEAAFVVIALVIMIRIDPLITAVTFLPLAGVVLFTHWMRSRLPRLWGQAREATTTVTNFIGDAAAAVQAIKVAGAEAAAVRRFTRLNHARAHAEVRSVTASTSVDAISQATITVGQGMVLLTGAGAMLSGRFSIGDFVLFAMYLDWMLELPRRLGRLLSQRKTSQKSLDRLQEAMGGTSASTLTTHRPLHLSGTLPPAVDVPRSVGKDRFRELVLDNLSYTHPDSGRGFAGVSLRIRRGTLTVITGEIGAGKSTLLEVLLGLREADSGQIRWNDTTVTDPAAFMVPPRVAYKPQTPRLFSEPLGDTILLGWPTGTLELALHRSAFESDVASMENGLDTMVGSRGVRLSGGQLQRASTARMLVRTAELYVIDDISSALDAQTERQIWERLHAASQTDGATYLVISHRPDTLRRADQIIVLDAGGIKAAGTLTELQEQSPDLRRIMSLGPDR